MNLSFLIVKTSAIGDVIHAFEVVEYLRERFPEARIDWVVEKGSRDLLLAHPLLNHVLVIDTKKWRKSLAHISTWREIKYFKQELQGCTYDAVFDLQGNTKSALVTALVKAKDKVGFGKSTVPEKPNLYVTNRHINPPEGINVRARYLYLVQRYFDDLNAFIPKGVVLKISSEEQAQLNTLCVSFVNQQKPCFMVCFGSRWPNKQLLKATLAQFLLLVDQAIKPFFLLIYGNEEEKRQAEELHAFFKETSLVVGSLSLPLWQALMEEVDGVIAVDSAGLHLAGTTSTPSFSLFGPSLAAIYKPLEERHKAIQGSCPYQLNFKTRCPHLRSCVSGACLHAFSAAELFDSFTNWHGNVYTL